VTVLFFAAIAVGCGGGGDRAGAPAQPESLDYVYRSPDGSLQLTLPTAWRVVDRAAVALTRDELEHLRETDPLYERAIARYRELIEEGTLLVAVDLSERGQEAATEAGTALSITLVPWNPEPPLPDKDAEILDVLSDRTADELKSVPEYSDVEVGRTMLGSLPASVFTWSRRGEDFDFVETGYIVVTAGAVFQVLGCSLARPLLEEYLPVCQRVVESLRVS